MTGATGKITLCGATTPVRWRAAETLAITATSINTNSIRTINDATAIAATMIRMVPREVGTFAIPGGAINEKRLIRETRASYRQLSAAGCHWVHPRQHYSDRYDRAKASAEPLELR